MLRLIIRVDNGARQERILAYLLCKLADCKDTHPYINTLSVSIVCDKRNTDHYTCWRSLKSRFIFLFFESIKYVPLTLKLLLCTVLNLIRYVQLSSCHKPINNLEICPSEIDRTSKG